MRLKKRVEILENRMNDFTYMFFDFRRETNDRLKHLEEQGQPDYQTEINHLQEQINIISELIEPLVLQKAEKEMRESANELCKFFEELFGKDNAGKKQRPKSRVKTTAQPENKEKRGRGRPRKESKYV